MRKKRQLLFSSGRVAVAFYWAVYTVEGNILRNRCDMTRENRKNSKKKGCGEVMLPGDPTALCDNQLTAGNIRSFQQPELWN